jgi:hypothetical protein
VDYFDGCQDQGPDSDGQGMHAAATGSAAPGSIQVNMLWRAPRTAAPSLAQPRHTAISAHTA